VAGVWAWASVARRLSGVQLVTADAHPGWSRRSARSVARRVVAALSQPHLRRVGPWFVWSAR